MTDTEDSFERTALRNLKLKDSPDLRALIADLVDAGRAGAEDAGKAIGLLDAGDVHGGVAELAQEVGFRGFWSRELIDFLRELWPAWRRVQKARFRRADLKRDRDGFRALVDEVVELCDAEEDEPLDVGQLLDRYQARLFPVETFWQLPLVAGVLNACQWISMTPRDVVELLPFCVEKVWPKSDPEGRDEVIMDIDAILRAAGVGDDVPTTPIIESLITDWGFSWERRDKDEAKYRERRLTPDQRKRRNQQSIRMLRSRRRPRGQET